jgi:3-hydroxybutyryl-CoA dehydratase
MTSVQLSTVSQICLIEDGSDIINMFYEEFIVGSEQKTPGRTVTDADVVIFAGLTGAYDTSNPLFLDEEYAKKTSFGHRIVPDLLTLSIATGLMYQLPTGPFGEGFVELLGMTFKATRPVMLGDTLRVIVKVAEKHPPKDGRGRVVLESTVSNQRDEVVMTTQGNFLVEQKKKKD